MASEKCKKTPLGNGKHVWIENQASRKTDSGWLKCQNGCGAKKRMPKGWKPDKEQSPTWYGNKRGIKETPLDTIAGQPVKGSAILIGRGIKAVVKKARGK